MGEAFIKNISLSFGFLDCATQQANTERAKSGRERKKMY
jgi:hypothetical protein